MAKCEKILIAGFSGAGKSTFLKAVAMDTPFGWDHFDDLDSLIAKKYKSDVHTIIQLEGWDKFREKERATLAEWLKGDYFGVLALGGGTLTKEIYPSLNLMKPVRIVHLHSDFETCWKRVNEPLAPVRPLVQKGKAELQKAYAEREPIFALIPWRIENPEGTSLKSLARKFWEKVLLL